MDWESIIGGIGIGSIAASAITQYFNAHESQKEKIFSKKEIAYLELMDALYFAEIMPTTENAKKYGLCHNKVCLVGFPNAIRFSQSVIDTSPGSDERKKHFKV